MDIAALPVMFIVFAHTRWIAMLVVSVGVIAFQLADLLLESVLSPYTHLTRRRIPYIDRLPGETWAALVGLPTATTIGAGLAAAAPMLMNDPRTLPTGITFAVCALVVPFVVVYVAGHRATAERSGRALALYDEQTPAAARLIQTTRRFDMLVDENRYVLARVRRRWLGSLEAPPPRAWPSRRGGWSRWTAPRWVIPAFVVAAAAVAAGLSAATVESARHVALDAAAAPLLAIVPALAAVLRVFRLCTQEQAEADRLRERHATLRAQVAAESVPAPVVERSRWRRAFDVLAGRDG